MAEITPNDIVNKVFRMTLRGYAADQVDDFLQEVSDSLFRTIEENQRLRAQIEELKSRVQQFTKTEDLIKNTLVLAERTAEETREQARKEADLLRREMQEKMRAERVELERTRQERLRVLAEFRAVLQAHATMLDAQERQMMTSPPGEEPRYGA